MAEDKMERAVQADERAALWDAEETVARERACSLVKERWLTGLDGKGAEAYLGKFPEAGLWKEPLVCTLDTGVRLLLVADRLKLLKPDQSRRLADRVNVLLGELKPFGKVYRVALPGDAPPVK